MPSERRDRLLHLGLAVAGAALLVLHAAHYWPTWTDDAYITFRYAWRAWHGAGFTFNDGERLEGLTNLGWGLLLAPLSGGDLLTASRVVGLACGVGAVGLLVDWGRRQGLGLAALVAMVAAMAVAPWPAHWLVQGMETPAAMLLCTLGWARYDRDARAGGLSSAAGLALAPWVRPDAALLAGVVGLWHLVRRGPVRARAAARSAALVLLSAGALVAVKLALFDAVLPLTWHVKTSGDRLARGQAYLQAFADTPQPLLPALLGVGLLAGLARALHRDDRGLPAVFAVAWLAAMASLGGDFMPNFRLLVPAWPALCACLAVLVQAGVDRAASAQLGPVARAGALVVVAAALWAPSRLDRVDQLNQTVAPNDALPHLQTTKAAPLWAPWADPDHGAGLEQRMPYPAAWSLVHAADGAQVAYTDIGLLGWVNPRVGVVDLLGLTDRVMAGQERDQPPWPYLQERLDWMILDVSGGLWGRYRDLLIEDGWRPAGGCESLWVLQNPRSTAQDPPLEVVAARMDDALRRAPDHRELHAAIASELESIERGSALLAGWLARLEGVHGAGWWPGGFDGARCGRVGSWPDQHVLHNPPLWPEPLLYDGHQDDPMQVAADPWEEQQARERIDCEEARRAARDAWQAAEEAWAAAPGADAHTPRRLARQAAAQAVLADGGLQAASEAHTAAQAVGTPPAAVQAADAAYRETKSADEACGDVVAPGTIAPRR